MDQIPTCLPSLDKLVQRSRYDRLSVLAATTIILAHAHFDIPSDQVPYFMLQLFHAVISILANNYDNALKITIEVYIFMIYTLQKIQFTWYLQLCSYFIVQC